MHLEHAIWAKSKQVLPKVIWEEPHRHPSLTVQPADQQMSLQTIVVLWCSWGHASHSLKT